MHLTERRLSQAVSVLMPVCNEEDVIREVLREWSEDVLRFLPSESELIFDDCSTDGTTSVLEAAALENPQIKLMRSARDGFFNSAMRLYRAARCPLVFFTDSDGQYVAQEFWNVAKDIDQFDMVHGAKISRKDPQYRLLASGVFNAIGRALLGTRGKDVNSAFRLIHRRLLDKVLPEIHRMPTLLNAEMYLRAEAMGFRIKNVPVMHRPRSHGRSRGLPFGRFARESWMAYRGLVRLREDLRALKSNPVLGIEATRRFTE